MDPLAVDKQRQLAKNACLYCRSKKIRCLESNVPGRCEKCYRLGQECHVAPSRQRRPKAHTPTPKVPVDVVDRLENLEQNLQNVTAQLAAQKSINSQKYQGYQNKDKKPLRSESTSLAQSAPDTNIYPIAANSSPPPDCFTKGLLTLDYGDALLQDFRFMSRNFAFVVIPENLTVSQLRIERPILLLALLAASSWRDRSLQTVLEEEYLKCLGTQMVVGGEQSLELLQSILIHLYWSHFHMKSSFKLNYFASAIVDALGLNRRPRGNEKERLGFKINFLQNSKSQNPEPLHWPAEARRAYIGCYVISASSCQVLHKAQVLKYSSYLEECAESLADEKLVPTDTTLPHYVRFLRQGDNVCESFGYNDYAQPPRIPDDKLQFYITSFEAQLEGLWRHIPPSLHHDPLIEYTHIIIRAYTLEIGLHNIPTNIPLTTFQTNILFSLLTIVQKTLHMFGTLSDRLIQSLSVYSWARLHYTMNLAIELTIGINNPSWDVRNVRDSLKLEDFIDILFERLERFSALITAEKGEGNWYQALLIQGKKVKAQYASGLLRKGIVLDVAHDEGAAGVVMPGGTEQALTGDYDVSGLVGFDFMPSNDWYFVPPGLEVDSRAGLTGTTQEY